MYASIARPVERLDAVLRGQDRIAIRRILRQLRHEADALMVVLAVGGEVLDLAGDDGLLPRRLPILNRAAPGLEQTTLRDGTQGEVLVARLRIWREWPLMGLHVVEPGRAGTEVLVELVERAAEEIEDVVLSRL